MNKPLTSEQFDDLVGAYALDAVEPGEAALVETYLATNSGARAEVDRLRAAASWFGASVALSPPPGMRSNLLERARFLNDQRRESFDGPAHRESFGVAAHREADAYLQATLSGVVASDLSRVTENGLTVRDLVAHLAVMESATTDSQGNPSLAHITATEVEDRTAAMLAASQDWSWETVQNEWQLAARASLEAAETSPELKFFAGHLPTQTALTVRAFETWIHAGDIAVATGGSRATLSGGAFHAMADFSMTLIPGCLFAREATRADACARVVLTGEGGGEWTIPFSLGSDTTSPPVVTITAPIYEWCLRIGDRIQMDDFPLELEGDEQAGRELVSAASAMAML